VTRYREVNRTQSLWQDFFLYSSCIGVLHRRSMPKTE
jgi:hypothetical protein